MKYSFALVVFVALLVTACKVVGQDAPPRIGISAPYTSGVVMIGGQPVVYYELSLKNLGSDTLLIKGLEIFSTTDALPLADLDAAGIAGRCSLLKGMPQGGPISLSPGDSCLIYMEVTLKKGVAVSRLRNRFKLEGSGKSLSADSFFATAFLDIKSDPAVVIGPPLKEGYWAAVYDPAWVRGHRRVVFSGSKGSFIPGRFAIDFVRLDAAGRFASGDDKMIVNWLGYGNEVIAVADGIVASAKDGVEESPSLPGKAVGEQDAPGNYISLKIGHEQYAFYEHLQPNSIKVKPGQQVKKGEVIAALGFTGQSTGPHLHFHLADRDASLLAQGVPFVFDTFELVGVYTRFETFGKERWTNAGADTVIKKERPQSNAVIGFR